MGYSIAKHISFERFNLGLCLFQRPSHRMISIVHSYFETRPNQDSALCQMAVTQRSIDFYGRTLCMPLALLINFSLFQYLATTYYKRRHDRNVILLLVCSIASFVVLIPISHPDDRVVDDLNDISEILSTMTFLIQITMIGREMNRKLKIRSLAWSAHAAELLTFFGILLSAKLFIELANPRINFYHMDEADNIMENVSLAFILFFRVYYVAHMRGLRATLRTKWREIVLYLLFVTHEYPFVILESVTGLDWQDVESLWHRVTMAACLLYTIRQKIVKSSSSKRATSKFVATTAESNYNGVLPPTGPPASRVWSMRLAKTRIASVKPIMKPVKVLTAKSSPTLISK